MGRRAKTLLAAVMLGIGCTPFSATTDPPVADDPVEDAGKTKTDGGTTRADATTSSTGPDGGFVCLKDAVFCDSLETDHPNADWTPPTVGGGNIGGGTIGNDATHVHTGSVALMSTLEPSIGDFRVQRFYRAVASTGKGVWKAWIWIDNVTVTTPIYVLQVRSDATSFSSVAFQLTSDGFKLYAEHPEVMSRDAHGDHLAAAYGKWIHVVLTFDFPGRTASATVDGVNSEGLKLDDFDFGMEPISTLNLAMGLAGYMQNPAVTMWFDDTEFYNTP